MVMERRHAKHLVRVRILLAVAPLAHLVRGRLDQDRQRFGGEDRARDQQQELGLEENRDRPERAADRQRAGIAHNTWAGYALNQRNPSDPPTSAPQKIVSSPAPGRWS